MSPYSWQVVVGMGFLTAYAGLLRWARRSYIARFNACWADAHKRVFLATAPPAAGTSTPAEHALAKLEKELDASRAECPGGDSQSREIADWVLLHEAKRQAVWLLPEDQVRARLDRAMGQLDELPPARRAEWRAAYRELDREEVTGVSGAVSARSLLFELLAELHNARDAKYSQLNSLYGKAFWLIAVALLPLTVLLLLGYAVILVAGAIGGLISRLQRLVYAEGLPTAYGSSWVPLFCAPLLGALAAWAGLNLVQLLKEFGVVSLANLLTTGEALRNPESAVIGLAVLFGVSERALIRFAKEAEKVIEVTDKKDKASTHEVALRAPTWTPPPGSSQPPVSSNGHAAVGTGSGGTTSG